MLAAKTGKKKANKAKIQSKKTKQRQRRKGQQEMPITSGNLTNRTIEESAL